MKEALTRCKDQSVVLHLKGIGGIGKSSLLDQWTSTIESTIRVDCEQHSEFYDRLNVLAKGAVLHGVSLQRFDVLWQIRQRFVEGVEPVREAGRQWAKDVIMAIPFIGTLTSIGTALSAISSKVTPKLKNKFSTAGKWLEERLGKNHIERLLEVLWKEPHHAEFLYLDALLEDINNRRNGTIPLLFLMDHFEYVDNEKAKWRISGRQITETELWCVFLSSLSNSVGVMASRRAAVDQMKERLEESELLELDHESSNEFLRLRNITDTNLQDKIVSVSGGNPFVIGAICDLVDVGDISIDEISDLGADTLEEVRIRTWRRLFNEAYDLTPFIDRAGLLPFFSRSIMNIIAPDMKAEQWDRLIRLSFVRNRGDETYVLHDLAEELIQAELGDRLQELSDEVTYKLDAISRRDSNLILMGLAISALAKASPRGAIDKLELEFLTQTATQASATVDEFLAMLDILRIDTEEGAIVIQDWRGWCLSELGRWAECEHILKDSLENARMLAREHPDDFLRYVARILQHISRFAYRVGSGQEVEESIRESISIYEGLYQTSKLLDDRPERIPILWIMGAYRRYGMYLYLAHRLKESEEILQRASELSNELPDTDVWWNKHTMRNVILSTLSMVQTSMGNPSTAESILREIVDSPRFDETDPFFRATTLGHLCRTLRKTNQLHESENAIKKALEIRMELYKKEPEVEWVNPVETLIVLGRLMMQTSRYVDAENQFNEALDLMRKHAKDEVPFFLAQAHSHLGVLYQRTKRYTQSEKSHVISLKIMREKVDASPAQHNPDLVESLNNYSLLLHKTGRFKEAESYYREAMEIARKIAQECSEHVEARNRLGTILNNYGNLLRELGRFPDAERVHNESLDIRRLLVKQTPEMFEKYLSWSLNNIGVLFLETDRKSESLKCFEEALQLLRRLAEKTEELALPGMGAVFSNLAFLHHQSGDQDEATKWLNEAARIDKILVQKEPRVFEDRFTGVKPENMDEVLLDL
jgi:tetratricopeptide (TPR) repeat protein